MIRKIQTILISLFAAAALAIIPAPAFAQSASPSPSPSTSPTTSVSPSTSVAPGQCGSTKTQIISCSSKDDGVQTIGELIKLAIFVLTILIGVVATGGLAYAAILYASAQDNQSQVTQAIAIIRNIVIGLVLYGLTVAIINWLIPGGVIGS